MGKNKKNKRIIKKSKIIKNNVTNTKEKGNPQDIATCLILAIEQNYITYRQFKEAQAIIDAKYDKPCWAKQEVKIK